MNTKSTRQFSYPHQVLAFSLFELWYFIDSILIYSVY